MTRRKSDWTHVMCGFVDRKMVYYIQLGLSETVDFPFGLCLTGHYKTEAEAIEAADTVDEYMDQFAKRKK